jgi:hypothetical protein
MKSEMVRQQEAIEVAFRRGFDQGFAKGLAQTEPPPRTDRFEQVDFREAAQIVADCAARGLGLAAAEHALLRRADGLDYLP